MVTVTSGTWAGAALTAAAASTTARVATAARMMFCLVITTTVLRQNVFGISDHRRMTVFNKQDQPLCDLLGKENASE